jgi:hypothetical protein
MVPFDTIYFTLMYARCVIHFLLIHNNTHYIQLHTLRTVLRALTNSTRICVILYVLIQILYAQLHKPYIQYTVLLHTHCMVPFNTIYFTLMYAHCVIPSLLIHNNTHHITAF